MRQRQRRNAMSALVPGWVWALLVGLAAAVPLVAAQARAFPARLDSYLTDGVTLSRNERQRLLNGEPLTKWLDADASKEVAVFGAVWVNAPVSRYVEGPTGLSGFTGMFVRRRVRDGTMAGLRSTKRRLERVVRLRQSCGPNAPPE
jgi:hypothetical protein